jgi:hypothetical protein
VTDGVVSADETDEEETLPQSPMSMQDGIKAVQRAFGQAATPPRWPMYVRQAKQFLRNAIENFDERKYGFASVVDLLRAAGKEGVLRIERDRQGAVRVFPGQNLVPKAPVFDVESEVETADAEAANVTVEEPGVVDVDAEPVAEESLPAAEPMAYTAAEEISEPPIMEAVTVDMAGEEQDEDDGPQPEDVDGNRIDFEPARPVRARKTASRRPATGRSTGARATKTARAAKAPRARKSGGRR